jgi:acetyl esterase/lipase
MWDDDKPFELNPHITITTNTPPTFIVQAEDDPVDNVNNSVIYFINLKKANIPAEMHLFAHGGHGFGLRPTKNPITHWPALAETWLKTIGLIPD